MLASCLFARGSRRKAERAQCSGRKNLTRTPLLHAGAHPPKAGSPQPGRKQPGLAHNRSRGAKAGKGDGAEEELLLRGADDEEQQDVADVVALLSRRDAQLEAELGAQHGGKPTPAEQVSEVEQAGQEGAP